MLAFGELRRFRNIGIAAADVPLAPLLNGLGTHEWAVTTNVPRAQQFFNQGVRLLYALQPSRGAARRFGKRPALGPGARDGVLGSGDGGRSEPERAVERGERAEGVRRDSGRPACRRRCVGSRAGARSRPWRCDSPRMASAIVRPSIARMRPRWRVSRRAYPGRSGRADVLRGRRHEHDAVGLLAEGRVTEARRPRSCSRRWKR